MTNCSESVAADDALETLQRQVVYQVGRCTLRFQRYEMLLKHLVVHSLFEGNVETGEQNLQLRRDEVAHDTLGSAIRKFCETVVVAPEDDEESEGVAVTKGPPSFRMRLGLGVPVEHQAALIAQLDELRQSRNYLIHHFLNDFDLMTLESCHKAKEKLDAIWSLVSGQLDQLKEWMRAWNEGTKLLAAFLASPEGERVLVHGLNPDGSVAVPAFTPIAEALKNAIARCESFDGWTSLSQAIAHMRAGYPDEYPKRYGLKTWAQVLRWTDLFDSKKRSGSESEAGEIFFRFRQDQAPELPASHQA